MDRSRTDEEMRMLETAARALPGGVLGSSRFPDDLAFIVKRGSGSKLYDVSGREYIDYLMGSGPLILGHAHPAVVAAVRAQLWHGTTYFLVNEPIVALADELCRAVPCAEQVRFTSTGTEATFFALRAARAYRKRDKVMKFEGGYHGSHDYALMSASPKSPKAFPAATADAAGIPHVLEGEVLIAPYNDLATVEALVAAYAGALAAVTVEPVRRPTPPQPVSLAGLGTPARRPGRHRPEVQPSGAGDRGDHGLRRRLHRSADHRLPRDTHGGRGAPQGLQRRVPAAGRRQGRVQDLRLSRPQRRRRGPDARGVCTGHRDRRVVAIASPPDP